MKLMPDPSNITLMPRAAGAASVSSFVEVPGDRAEEPTGNKEDRRK
ncbi:MAG TPA: hypothetical protein VFY29_06535 [Terriglobia bacterium]|nr:hypothetical protein [Terriglobia bacterium]